MIRERKIIIAIDGVAASGKGSIARLISDRFNLDYLETGLLYRAVGYFMKKENITLNNLSKLISFAKNLDLNTINTLNLNNEEVAKAAAVVAKIPEVRDALFLIQVNFANNPSIGKSGTVLDGRDIGTKICPSADVKFFFTASQNVRIQRRYNQLKLVNSAVSFNEIKNSIQKRDLSDNFLNIAAINNKDYIIIDNTQLSLTDAFKVCEKHIEMILNKKL